MWPEKDPSSIRWLEWCWGKPVYIGAPVALGVFLVLFWDLVYVLYWWITHWGRK